MSNPDDHLRRPPPERPGITEPQVYPEPGTTGAKVEEHPRPPEPPREPDALLESVAYHRDAIASAAGRLYDRLIWHRAEARRIEVELETIRRGVPR